MEIPAGPIRSGVNSGTNTSANAGGVSNNAPGTPLSAPSVANLPKELLRPQVIEAVVLRNSPLASTPDQRGSTLPLNLGGTLFAASNAGNANSATPTGGTLINPGATNPAPTTTPATGATPPGATVPVPLNALLRATAPSLGTGATTSTVPALPGQAQPAPPNTSLPLLNMPLLQNTQSTAANTLFRVALQWQGKTFEVVSPQPLPVATPIKIQINNRNELILRDIAPPAAPTATARASATAPLPQETPLLNIRQQALRDVPPLVRENLPRQQPLTTLLPVLRALLAPEQQTKMPPALTRAILNLWQSLPLPRQLQQPETLKQVLRNSGSFFEANTASARAVATENPQALPRVLSTDVKSQITLLLTLLKSRSAAASTDATAAADTPVEVDMVYQKPLPRQNNTPTQPLHNVDENAELLQQLSKVLEGGLSRIHLHQLDSVVSRHTGAEAIPTVPTWVMELPVRTQHGYDQINVRIEEHAAKQEQQRKKQWIVQLGFDLHELGKLSATLSIMDRSVAATLWAEQESTHRTVQREMATLRTGLESVGVNVTEMQCRHGIPPERSGLILQRLVDTHS
jgi:hypothetical protein